MIQRAQTLFLLGVSVCMGMVLAYYIWGELIPEQNQVIRFSALEMEIIDTQGTEDYADDVVLETRATWYIAVLAILSSLVALFSIFQYKNRLNQMKLGALNALLMAATLGISFYHAYQYENISPTTTGTYTFGFVLPAGAMILNILANRFIRKDEKLVKSVDRIR